MSQLNVNTINERTSASGVTIDGVLIKDNKLASGTGNVLQVVTGTDSTAANITATSFTDTGLSASITPSSTSSKVLVICSMHTFVYAPGDIPYAYLKLLRDSTSLTEFQNGSKADAHEGDNNAYIAHAPTVIYLDSPSSTSSLTYKTQAKYVGSGSGYITTANSGQTESLILIEIGG
tara:strand:- start:25 stop:555 length:531 start_codon:yes stop_codon:yes gene_type:complete